PLERNHDAPHRAEQADVGTDRTDVGEELEVALQPVELARGGHAHRALRAFELDPAVDAATFADAIELAEAAFEDRLQPARVAPPALRAGVQLGQVGTGPEPLLETVGLVLGAAEQAALAEDDHPGRDRG